MTILHKISFLFLFIIGQQHLYAQSKPFEGSVSYKHLVIMKDTTQSNINLIKFYGTKSVMTIKDGKCNWEYINSTMERELFLSKEKKIYRTYKNTKGYFISDSDKPEEEIVKIYPIKTSQKGDVLGKKCDMLMLKSKFLGKDSEVRGRVFFFSKDYPLDAKMFANQKANNQDIIYEKIKAVPLRIIIIHKTYKVIFVAYKISEKPEANAFFIDKTAPMKKG